MPPLWACQMGFQLQEPRRPFSVQPGLIGVCWLLLLSPAGPDTKEQRGPRPGTACLPSIFHVYDGVGSPFN